MHIVESVGQSVIELVAQTAQSIGHTGGDGGDGVRGQHLGVGSQTVEVLGVCTLDDLCQIDGDVAVFEVHPNRAALCSELFVDDVFDDAVERVADLDRYSGSGSADLDRGNPGVEVDADACELTEQPGFTDGAFERGARGIDEFGELSGEATDRRAREGEDPVGDDVLRGRVGSVAFSGGADRAEFE